MRADYVQYLKVGQVCIPLEIRFINPKSKEEHVESGATAKWVEAKHHKEVRELIKPVLDAAMKYHQEMSGMEAQNEQLGDVKYLPGASMALGFVFCANRGRHTNVVETSLQDPDSTGIWYDDEEDSDDVDEDTGLKDYGGICSRYQAARVYIRACALPVVGRINQTETQKSLSKALGVKYDLCRSYFKPSAK